MAKKLHINGKFGGIEVESASVGQTIVVKAVDENGKPTEWETTDLSKKIVANFTGDGTSENPYVCDKTHSELYDAYYNGYEITATFTGNCDDRYFSDLKLSLRGAPMPVFDFSSVILYKKYIEITFDDTNFIAVVHASFNTDISLTKYGIPADAGAVGEKFEEIQKSSDWNQNDETQPDYIKNRPFYEIVSQEDIITEQTNAFSYLSYKDCYGVSITDYTAGKLWNYEGMILKVLWDGIVYDAPCMTDNSNIPYIGDEDFIEFPFYFHMNLVESTGPQGYGVYTSDTSSSHTFRLYKEISDIKCLNAKFIPDGIFYSKQEIDSIMGSYITDIDALLGGDS